MSASAEVYDPVSGSFGVTGNLTTARQVQTATLLSNGIVLVAGGFTDNNPGLTSAELYQPASFTPANLTSIAVGPANPFLLVGGTQELIAIGTFSDNSTQQLASVIWSSSDTTVVTVTNDSGSNSGITNDSKIVVWRAPAWRAMRDLPVHVGTQPKRPCNSRSDDNDYWFVGCHLQLQHAAREFLG